jgi:16S rRNA processing protein RimM
MSAQKTDDILLAIIGAPHGVRGELRVKSFTEEPEGFAEYGPLHDAKGRVFNVEMTRVSKSVVITRFAEIRSREDAEAVNGIELFVAREALPETDDPDEFYLDDLIGLSVVSADGVALGEVKAVHDFGGGDILEIQFRNGKTELLPFTREVVPEIDLDAGTLTLVMPGEIGAEEQSR